MAYQYSLQDLENDLRQNSYTPLTDEQIKKKAQTKYQSAYDQQRLSANQQYNANALSLDNQLNSLQGVYDKQRQSSADSYKNAYSQTDRNALSRGMQRSSYNAATLANISAQGAKAQDEITANQTLDANNILSKKQQLRSSLAERMKQYDDSQRNDVDSYMNDLQDQEYTRKQENDQYYNKLRAMMYEYALANDSAAGGSGGGSSGGGSSGGTHISSRASSANRMPVTDDSLMLQLDSAISRYGANAIKAGAKYLTKGKPQTPQLWSGLNQTPQLWSGLNTSTKHNAKDNKKLNRVYFTK